MIIKSYSSKGLPILYTEPRNICISKQFKDATALTQNEYADGLGSGLKWKFECIPTISCMKGSDAACQPDPKSKYPQNCCAEFIVTDVFTPVAEVSE